MTGRPSQSLRRRTYRLLIIYACCSLPLVAFGAFQSMQTNSNSPLDWVSPSLPPRAEYDLHVKQFGSGDLVAASWPACTIDEPRLDTLLTNLRSHPLFHDKQGAPYFDRVSCGRELVAKLASGSVPISRSAAAERLRGTFVGPDGQQTCVVISLTRSALVRRERLVELIQSCISSVCDVPRDELHLAGPVIDGLTVDQAGRDSLDRLAVPSAAIVLILACLCLKSLRAGMIVFGLSVYCQGATLALIHFCGEPMNALLIVLPPLIQVLTVAGGVHLTNYYFETGQAHGQRLAPWEAIKIGWLPCLLSAGTTALGIGSLVTSRLSPVRSFGVYGSLGVVLSAALLILLVPAVWENWPPRQRRAARGKAQRKKSPEMFLTQWVTRNWRAVLMVSAVAMVAGSWHLKDLKTSVRIETLFSADSRILSDYRWIEEHVGPLVPIDVVVSWPADSPTSLPQRLERIANLQRVVANVPDVAATLSAVQFVPAPVLLLEPPADGGGRILAQLADAARPGLIDAGFVVESEDRQFWRLTARVSSLAPIDYSRFLARLREHIAPELTADAGADGIEVRYTGIMPLVHEIQRLLMHDLLRSFAGAVLTITVIMTLAQGGIAAGLVAMIPNVFPIVLLFGILGWQDVPLDIGTVMTASVALGIAVDDTLHFLSFFHRGLGQGLARPLAIGFAYRHCSAAMIQTSVICGLGMLVFCLSDFLPTSRFAWMTSSFILTTLLADLLLLPALLASPLGRWFAAGDSFSEPEPPVVTRLASGPVFQEDRDAAKSA